jgi:hypothetical protein
VSYAYDSVGRRTRMSWPDGNYLTYDWNVASQLTHIRENAASSGTGVLAVGARLVGPVWGKAHGMVSRRTSLMRGMRNGADQGQAGCAPVELRKGSIRSGIAAGWTRTGAPRVRVTGQPEGLHA